MKITEGEGDIFETNVSCERLHSIKIELITFVGSSLSYVSNGQGING